MEWPVATSFTAEAEHVKKEQMWRTPLLAQNWDADLPAKGLTMAPKGMEKLLYMLHSRNSLEVSL